MAPSLVLLRPTNDSYPPLLLVVIAVAGTIALLTVYKWWQKHIARTKYAASRGCKPLRRAKQKDPIFALDRFLQLGKAAQDRTYLQTIQRWFAEDGSTFAIRLMGDDMIFTNEPKNVQAVLVSNFKSFEMGQRRRDHSQQLLGVGIFNADGQQWEHGRALVRPNFSRKQVSDLHIFETHSQALMRAVDEMGKDRSFVDMQEWFFRFTLDVGTEYLFGESTGVLDPNATKLAQSFAWAFGVGVDGIAQRIRLGKFGRFYYDSRYNKACKIVHDYVEPIIARAMTQVQSGASEDSMEKDERYTFLMTMAREGASAKELRDQALNVLVAARDTSACLVSAAFFELGQHPDMLATLRSEVAQLNGRLPTYEDIKDMKYLSSFLRETLRVHPPVPLNMRVSREDTFLPTGGGADGQSPVFVPKDQLVVYQVFSMHRRPDLWGSNAEVFDPSRWDKSRPTFEYLPFNAGPRICPGQQFALTETSYLIIRMIQTYSVIEARKPGEAWFESLTLTCATGNGVWLKFQR